MAKKEFRKMHPAGLKPSRITRYFTTLQDMDKWYIPNEYTPEKRRVKDICKNVFNGFKNRVPVLNALKTYKVKEYLILDLVAGLALIGLHFPQGLAYGLLAGLTPNIGMISTIFPVILYMMFGSSPHASIGTNAIVSIIVGDVFLEADIKNRLDEISSSQQKVLEMNVTKLSNFSVNTEFDEANEISYEAVMNYKISLVAGVTFYTGIIFLIMAIFKMGFIVTYLSQSFMSGFTTGVGVHIFSSQIKVAMGLKLAPYTGAGKLVMLYYSVFQNILTTNVADLIVTIICVAILLLVKILINEKFKLKTPIPIDFILLVVATLISHFAHLPAMFNTHSIGKVELGIPAPKIPSLQPASTLIVHAIEVAMVTFFLNISVSKIIAKHHDYELDENIETSAYAITNVVSSFFSNIPASIAPPRSLLLSTMGAKTTLNSFTTSVIMLALIFYFGQFFESCPRSVLASMIMVAMKDLLRQVVVLPTLWKINKNDFTTWLIAALTCILLDITYGLALGVLVSLISVINQSQRGRVSVLEKSEFEDLYLDKHDYSGVNEVPGIKIIRIEASLYFATADKFRKSIMKCIHSQMPSKKDKEKNVNGGLRRNNNDSEASALRLTNIKEDPDSDTNDEEENDNLNDDLDTKVQILILDCIPINFIDVTGLDMLKLVIMELSCSDIKVYLARCSRYMIRMLDKSDFFECVPKQHVFVDLPDAVALAKEIIRDKDHKFKEHIATLVKMIPNRNSFSSLLVDDIHDPFHVIERNYHTVH